MPIIPKYKQNFQTHMIESQGRPIALSVLENDPSATTVLFYPGTMCSPLMYSVFLQELFNCGLNVVGIHPLSHRLSPVVKKDFTFDDILQNGKDAELFARERFSGPIVLCGHSQGGILALTHCLDNPHIQACFPISTLLPHIANAAQVTRFGFAQNHRHILLPLLRFFAKICPTLPVPLNFYLQPQRIFANAHKVSCPEKNCRASYPLSLIASLFSQDLSAAEESGHINCPLHLITAKDDMLFSLSMMHDVFTRIQAKQKKLYVVEGGGHLCVVSTVYAQHIATHIAESCASYMLRICTPYKTS